MDNEQKFREVYTRRLTAAIQSFPQEYNYPIEDVPVVVERMINAIKRGGFLASPTVKATAKECGVVPQTAMNIREYVLGKLEVINE